MVKIYVEKKLLEENMLKLTVSPGEFLMIGEDIKIIFAGSDRSKIPIAIEAPRERAIVRSSAKEVQGFEGIEKIAKPYIEKQPLSGEAQAKIKAIVAEDRKKSTKTNIR